METIFIQIASYKDPELVKTITDSIVKATYPERLRFGICWQYEEGESLGTYETDFRFKIHKMYWKNARGVGWARSICNQLYTDETFTLQIDSHHRFENGWDTKLIDQWKGCKHEKAVLTGYPPGYEYVNGKEVKNYLPPMTMIVKGFDYGFIPTFKSGHVVNTPKVKTPFRGCFIAAGFFFTVGSVCKEVPYIKEVYFTGEEILYSIRLFTFGYRIFHPNIWLIWHMYERPTCEKHWDDFTKKEELKSTYGDIQGISMKFLHGALHGDPKYKYLFGNINDITDFEMYSGVSIKHRTIHPKQLKGYEPPFAFVHGWEDEVKPLREFKVSLDLDIEKIQDRKDYTFWYFGLHDKDLNEIHRDDIHDKPGILFKRRPVKYINTILMREKPVKYILWPHSKEKGWHERLVFNIPDGAIT